MHKLYEQSYLSNYNPKQINSIGCVYPSTNVYFNIGRLAYIKCENFFTAKEVHKDACKMLGENNEIAFVKDLCVNLGNISRIHLDDRSKSNSSAVEIYYKDGSVDKVPCASSKDSRLTYGSLSYRFQCYKDAQNRNSGVHNDEFYI